ncbi:transcription factor Opi1 [Xylariaceae sp. FL0594]|nr:transcription factor Opi1 [Xylariaceae sp. FL0594]
MDVDTPKSASPDRFLNGRSSSVSLDDPDVRMAAEALDSLRTDFVSSPRHQQSPSPQRFTAGHHQEPLLSLLTTSHPFLATTIGSATSAYESSKNYSSRIKTSIEYVEGYVIPIANTVGSVGRKTGVENGVRWFLRRSRPQNETEVESQGSSKRRKFGPGDDCHTGATPETGSGTQTPRQTPRASMELSRDRQLSIASTVETLPAYDEFRSPPYAEHLTGPDNRPNGVTWHSRLIMSTSGLSIAMSDESLRRLKYCLSWIRWANGNIRDAVNALTITMEKFERKAHEGANGSQTQDGSSSDGAEDRSQLAAKVTMLRLEVVKTLREVTNTVSEYAGGALPENARELVRRHLTSLPQRFHMASMAANRRENEEGRKAETPSDDRMDDGRNEQEQEVDKKTRESAKLVLVIAKEGLEMMSQVSGILNGTIESAEEWCERLGKEKNEKPDDMYDAPQALPEIPFGDTKTG